jgi:hypothetical protein
MRWAVGRGGAGDGARAGERCERHPCPNVQRAWRQHVDELHACGYLVAHVGHGDRVQEGVAVVEDPVGVGGLRDLEIRWCRLVHGGLDTARGVHDRDVQLAFGRY